MGKPFDALKALRDTGAPGRMWTLAGQARNLAGPLAANTHIHLPPNFSAFESVGQAVALAAEEGLGVLGATNYYDFGVYAEFAGEAARRGIFPLFGVEVIALVDDLKRRGVRVNDPANPGKMYLCGKGITRFAPPANRAEALLAGIRRSDSKRIAAMIARLEGIFRDHGVETGLDEKAVRVMVARRIGCPQETVTLQERHVALAFQEAFFERVGTPERRVLLADIFGVPPQAQAADRVGLQNEIRMHLMKAGKPAFVEEEFPAFDEAFGLILELGGIPCYPTLADGTSPVCEFEKPVEALVDSIAARNIHCAEFIPVRNDVSVLERYVPAIRAAGLVVTAGTEHNTLKRLPLLPTASGGVSIPPEVQAIFAEGARVVAAHQFLSVYGECGFVDDEGRPNGAYDDAEERIGAFSRLGAAVIARYRQTYGADEKEH
ncbi:MAG: hypothetical protein J7M19_10300 [Planctomycetes bacterium]|nr:hypothetical protein [Planctomycetota bacterium]